jgi:hypothetical protein
MTNRQQCIYSCLVMMVISTSLAAQVQVSKEPMHKPVLENKYLRLLDVWLAPGDTTQFHVHSTPSLFLQLSAVTIGSQIKGQKWVKEKTETGKSWYRSFTPDSMIHRVCNSDTVPFHVTDLELLTAYNGPSADPLPFTMLYDNERAAVYQLTAESLDGSIIQDRGPIIVQLAEGEEVLFHDIPSDDRKTLTTGHYLYIAPGAYFSFTKKGGGKINMILYELR